MFNTYLNQTDRYIILTNRFYNEWDYKWKKNWRVPFGNYNWNEDSTDSEMDKKSFSWSYPIRSTYPKNWMPWMYFDGMVISGDDMGNLALGYVMESLGYDAEEYHPWNDKKGSRDWNMIEYGAQMAREGR